MRVPVQLLSHDSFRVVIEGHDIWFNPQDFKRIYGTPNAKAQATWCFLTHIEPVYIPSLLEWAKDFKNLHFVTGPSAHADLVYAGVPSEQLVVADSHGCAITAKLSFKAVGNDSNSPSYLLSTPSGNLLFASPSFAQTDDAKLVQKVGDVDTVFLPIGEPTKTSPTPNPQALTARQGFELAQQLNARQVAVSSQSTTECGLYAEELRLLQQKMGCQFNLLIDPLYIQVGPAMASIVIRTLNEARYLGELLKGLQKQVTNGLNYEVVLIDSGSTDDTVQIAQEYGCRVLYIKREEFSFGRSLNIGCDAARGDILVITSGHCVPADEHWLQNLCAPLIAGQATYTYGKQLGGSTSWFSECQVFQKYFPDESRIPQQGFYVNNANSALLKSAWQRYQFDEALTGLEDMALAQKLVKEGGHVAYVADARVYHHHSETWTQVRRRFEREAMALQQIMPNVHVSLLDTVRYTLSSISRDWRQARKAGIWWNKAREIVLYRFNQYTGSYKGNHQLRRLSQADKDKYFYPN